MHLDVEKIRRLIAKSSPQEVADKMGIKRPSLLQLLYPDANPTLATLNKLAKALGVKAKSLIMEKP